MTSKLVSIVMPVFNGAAFVGEAIESALAQSWPEIEVIVVDDGSDDGGATRRVVQSFGDAVRFIEQRNGGVAAALNTGIAAMRGDWFAWLSHDDSYHPDRIARHAAAAMERSAPAVTFGDVDIVDEGGRFIGTTHHTRGFPDDGAVGNGIWAVLEGRLNGCAMLVPRRWIVDAGGFDPHLPTTQDYALWHRLALRHPFLPVPGALVRQRSHAAQGSRAARHLEEASLLWLAMLDHLETLGESPGAKLALLRRAEGALRRFPYLGARAYVEERLHRLVGMFPVDVVLCGPADSAAIGDALLRLGEAGAQVAGLILLDASGPLEPAFALGFAGIGRPATIVRAGRAGRIAAALDAALAGGDAPLVAVLETRSKPDAARLREGLRAVAGGAAAGWIAPAPDGEGLGCLILERRALSAAFAGMPAGSGAVPAAFARLGRVAQAADFPPAPPLPGIDAPPTPSPMRKAQGRRSEKLARMPDPRRQTILFVVHGWGGGTLRYAGTLAAAIGDRANVLFGWGGNEQTFRLSSLAPDVPEWEWDVAAQGVAPLAQALRGFGVARVDVMHSIGFDSWIEALLDALSVPFDVTLLDYHQLANDPHLTDAAGRFVGDAALADPGHPARRQGPPRLLLRAAQRRIACSRDLAWRAGRLMGGLAVVPAYLPEPGRPRDFAIHAPPLAAGDKLRVLCLGRLTPHKGLSDIVAVARAVQARRLPIEIACLGEDLGAVPADLQQGGVVRVLGGYADAALHRILCRLRPHLAWLPFVAPETHSFALSDCMLHGLPILATGIGAIPERVEGRPATWLVRPEEAYPTAFLGWIERLMRDRLQTPPRWLSTSHLPPAVPDFYDAAYLV